jgi:hypothetical protein
MKNKILNLLRTGVALAVLNAPFTTSFAQGSLIPPAGTPAPVMKSLDQIEPRIAVNSLPGTANGMHVINQTGNYYLTADVVGTVGKHGILINAKDVTIDLNGFTILGTVAGAVNGITLLDEDGGYGSGLTVRNGTIENWGGGGIQYFSQPARLIEDVSIRGCKAGIRLHTVDIIRRCTVVGGGGATGGISITDGFTKVEDSRVQGIFAGATAAAGISLNNGLVQNSQVLSISGNPAYGIKIDSQSGVVDRCKVDQVYGSALTSVGIKATTVRDSSFTDGYSFGANASLTGIAGQHIERCTVKTIPAGASGTGIGIQGIASGGLIAQCLVEQVSGYRAYGVEVSTNSFSVVNTKINNVIGNGANTFGIRSESPSFTVAGCDVSAVTNSTGNAWGIYSQGGLIERCNVSRTRNDGIFANGYSTVKNCRVDTAGFGGTGAGIWAGSLKNLVEGNHVSGSDVGIQVLANSSGAVLRNVCQDNTVNYSVAGASVAPIVNAAGAATATNPLVNLGL